MTRNDAIRLMIQLEGGEANLKGDPGGHTKYGITQGTLTALQGRTFPVVLPQNVADLTPPEAEYIYRGVDWAKIRGDDLPPALAALVLNSAVNQGEPTAVAMLQECVGVPVDFLMGPHTLEAVKAWKSPYMPGQSLAEEYAAHVGVKYASLYAKEGQFELGWLRRLFRVYTLAVSS
jgi:lysozyme family protein